MTIAKSSFTVFHNMMFDICKSRCNMLRKNGSRAVTWVWYETRFIRTFVQFRQPIKFRQFTFINFDIDFGESIDMMHKKLVFRQLSKYIILCTRRIKFPFQNSHVVSFSNNDHVIRCFIVRSKYIFNLCYHFLTLRCWTFIFGIHTPLIDIIVCLFLFRGCNWLHGT